MTAQTLSSSRRRPLRLWPGVAIVVLQWAAWWGFKRLIPGFAGFEKAALVGIAGSALVLLWWLFLSQARWSERLGAVALIAAGLAGAWALKHESMGPHWLAIYAIPILMTLFVAGLVLTRSWEDGRRRAALAATLLVGSLGWLLARTEGINGDHVSDFHWRWTASAEDLLLAEGGGGAAGLSLAAASAREEAAWPGFRGPGRDGIVPGVAIGTDWSQSPPVEVWRRPVGPAWSSFAVQGGVFYTQEQRGEEEVVTAYALASGEPVWSHGDPVRFFESNAGAGPRATPTLHEGRVYSLGATGLLNALDAADGRVIWSRDLSADSGVEVPTWGFSASPLVIGEQVVVAAAGRVVAYERASGELSWLGPDDGQGYSSPHRLVVDGVEQIVMLNADGAAGLDPADGRLLWEHEWPGFIMTQPAVTADGEILVGSDKTGTARLAVRRGADGWTVEERWSSIRLKPYFNDFVVHDGHAYGFDGRILACIGLEDGERRWKGGRYGNGQLLLLADQDLLLVLTEKGDLALVRARPDGFEEIGRMEAIEGKTWNHPVLVEDLLLVRNAEEMAAFRLPGGASS